MRTSTRPVRRAAAPLSGLALVLGLGGCTGLSGTPPAPAAGRRRWSSPSAPTTPPGG